MKILITGVTGFLGGRLAQHLADRGHELRGLVRDGSRWSPPSGATAVTGDVTDPESVRRAVEGCEAVIHAAALVRVWVKDPATMDRANVEGLRNVAEASRAAGARLVYTSSFIALGPTDGTTLDEESPRASEVFHNDYERTKTLADRLARRLGEDGVELVRVYPGVVFGPGALTAGNHVVQLLLQHARGKLPGYLGAGDLRQCFAYVDDVVVGIERALEHGRPGAGYILGGENRTAIELFEAFREASGVRPPSRKIPFGLATWIGRLQRWRAEWFGVEPELTDGVVGIYRREWAFSSALAQRELDYRITPFPEAIARTTRWLQQQGALAARG